MSGSDTTKILLSFAMANHGANFANWLRDRLMKSYNFYNVKAVYVDSVVSRSGDTIHSMGNAKVVNGGGGNQTIVENKSPRPPPKPPSGVATVTPDIRAHMKSETGAISIGAMRDDWNVLYKTAMSQASVMLFVYTSEYNNSIWCMKEWGSSIWRTVSGGGANKRHCVACSLSSPMVAIWSASIRPTLQD